MTSKPASDLLSGRLGKTLRCRATAKTHIGVSSRARELIDLGHWFPIVMGNAGGDRHLTEAGRGARGGLRHA
jgi:hypothetical protein